MHRMKGLVFLLLVMSAPLWALTEARLLSQSSSGQTVVFNLGSHDGIRQGDYAVILHQIRSLETRDLRIIPVAKARNIKLNSDSSVWILYKVYDSGLLVNKEKFVILSESHVLSGRRPPKLGRITLVTTKDDVEEQTKYNLEDDKDRLGKLKSKYQELAVTHETNYHSDNDADLVDIEVWKNNKDHRYRSSLYKSPNRTEWRRQMRLATFEKLVAGYLKKVNDPDFNYDAFYERQRKSEWANEFTLYSVESEYSRFLRAQSKKETADAKLFRSILEKGESWSEDYSDEELKIVLNKVSVLQEKDRREYVIAKPTRYLAAFDYGFFLTDAQTKDDPSYQRDSRYSTEVDFEVTPFLKHHSLEHFTLNGSVRMSKTAFEADGFNSDLDETSVSIGANWYPVYAPYAYESPVWFLGTYIRSGFAKASAPTVGQTANYTVFTLPGFRAGFKYLLKNNFGIRLILSLETLKIDRYETSTFDSVFPEESNIVEGKMSVGMAYAF